MTTVDPQTREEAAVTPESTTARDLAAAARKARRDTWLRVVLPIASFALVIALWQAFVVLFDVKQYILPAPTVVIREFVDSLPVLWVHTVATAKEVILGFLLAAVVSIPLAYAISALKTLEVATYPLIVVLQTIPKIAVAPLFIVWFGFGSMPKIMLTFLLCFFPVLVDSITGFKALDERLLYITRSMGASRTQTFRYVRMPAALPFIFSGLKVAVVLAVTGAIVAEFVGSNAGLGYLLLRASANLDTAMIFAVLVALSILGLLFSFVVESIEKLVAPWRRKASS